MPSFKGWHLSLNQAKSHFIKIYAECKTELEKLATTH